jgi:hypothetical protein
MIGKVVDINSKYAVVLNNDMSYEKIKINNNLKLGKSIYYFKENLYIEKPKRLKNIVIAAAILFMIVFIQPPAVEAIAFGYISVDINPSIQLEIDKNLDVIKIEAKNKDAESIIKDDWIGNNYKIVIDEIIKSAESKGILNEKRDFVLVSYYFNDNSEESEIEFNESIDELYNMSNQNYSIAVVKGDKKALEESKLSGETLGRKVLNREMNQKVDDLLDAKDKIKENRNFTIYDNNKNGMPVQSQKGSENNNSDANIENNRDNENSNKPNDNGVQKQDKEIKEDNSNTQDDKDSNSNKKVKEEEEKIEIENEIENKEKMEKSNGNSDNSQNDNKSDNGKSNNNNGKSKK